MLNLVHALNITLSENKKCYTGFVTKVDLLIKELESTPDFLLDEVLDFLQFVKRKHAVSETALLSEASLAIDWLSAEEEQAWQDL